MARRPRATWRLISSCIALSTLAAPALAQEPATGQHEHMQMSDQGWQFMQDGIVFGTFNRQGSPRGDKEFIAQNWYMGMLTRKVGKAR
jgi:hypothetical protein